MGKIHGWVMYSSLFPSVQDVWESSNKHQHSCHWDTFRGHPHLPTVAACQQDEDSSWGDGGAQLPLVLAEGLLAVALQFARNVFCWVVAGLQREHARLALQTHTYCKARIKADKGYPCSTQSNSQFPQLHSTDCQINCWSCHEAGIDRAPQALVYFKSMSPH